MPPPRTGPPFPYMIFSYHEPCYLAASSAGRVSPACGVWVIAVSIHEATQTYIPAAPIEIDERVTCSARCRRKRFLRAVS